MAFFCKGVICASAGPGAGWDFDRRRRRREGEISGAAVGDWQGGESRRRQSRAPQEGLRSKFKSRATRKCGLFCLAKGLFTRAPVPARAEISTAAGGGGREKSQAQRSATGKVAEAAADRSRAPQEGLRSKFNPEPHESVAFFVWQRGYSPERRFRRGLRFDAAGGGGRRNLRRSGRRLARRRKPPADRAGHRKRACKASSNPEPHESVAFFVWQRGYSPERRFRRGLRFRRRRRRREGEISGAADGDWQGGGSRRRQSRAPQEGLRSKFKSRATRKGEAS